jgi:PTS hybrid protein
LVGIVVVSHSSELASGLAELAMEMAGPDVRIELAGGAPDGGLGTSEDLVRAAIKAANQGDGVVVLGDLGSAFLTVRHVLERHANGAVQIVDAPLVEGVVAAAVTSSAGRPLAEVASAAEETRGARKL